MSPTCPTCGTELKIANGYELEEAEPAPSGRNWRRLMVWMVVALAALGACGIVIYWR